MKIIEYQAKAWRIAEDKGFHTEKPTDATLARLCLVHTEISEAAQDVKRHWVGEPTKEQAQAFGEEMADAVIRILDLCGILRIDLEACMDAKMAKNEGRPHLYNTAGNKSG